ncbi:nibrin isoform X2 [Polistes fuscatus]|uniref:nibrin isoform X2 n=1 Tax=Polistes fuscatus TaxID=30207 RepID=UPI001CAA1D1D|nr:nibrin isoform X2 [Polistes fuscatus]
MKYLCKVFIVKYIPIITLTSGLEEEGKNKLEEIMKQIDGIIVNNWQQHCTHLTVLCPKLTEKVAVALAAGIVIVTVDYWEAVKFAMENEHPIPKTDNYIPRIKEEYIPRGIVSLHPNDKRKKLFNKKSFYFYDLNLFEMYKLMVKLADGEAFFIDLKINQDLWFGEDAVHVQTNKENELSRIFRRHYDNIFWTLQRNKQRFIHDSEIPLAILYCSIEKYCNPKYQFSNVFKKEEKFDFFLPETLVMDTQDLELITEVSAPTQRTFYTKQKDNVKKSSEFVDNSDRYTEVSAREKSDDEISEILISDDEEVSNNFIQPTTSSSSLLPKFTESEESSSSDLFIDNVEVRENSSNEERDTFTAKESQSFVGQQETKITENLSTMKVLSNKCLQNENTTESAITSNILIQKRSIGKTFRKANVKIPEKRIRL